MHNNLTKSAQTLISPLQIGNITLPNALALAPMAGVTDLPYRLLCHEMGAGLVCMEMVSAKAIYYNNKKTDDLMEIHPDERPVSLQLFGSDADIISEMAKKIEERPFDILDFNMGCPVPKVVGNHEGSALMKDPALAKEILSKLAKAIQKPVTVKIRKGFDDDHINAVEIAKIAEDSGVAAVAVHGRTREQYYSGKADWDIIAAVKDAVKIPVFGNGDVTDTASALSMIEHTGCDGIMIGRAVKGNPFLFRTILTESKQLLTESSDDSGDATRERDANRQTDVSAKHLFSGMEVTSQELKETILRHARLMVEYKGEYIAIRQMRSHLCWYTQGLHGSAAIRRKACELETLSQLEELVGDF
ncbi:MAG: tRNA dihydrouridine synthase DusB [Lachnospiraceae bacterium]|nr:tRNA dihydrouridine synthase DusB [Lachnospiraceae bacterium]